MWDQGIGGLQQRLLNHRQASPYRPNRPTFERSTLHPTLAYGTIAFPHSCGAWSRLLITRGPFFQASCRGFLPAIRRRTSIVSARMRKREGLTLLHPTSRRALIAVTALPLAMRVGKQCPRRAPLASESSPKKQAHLTASLERLVSREPSSAGYISAELVRSESPWPTARAAGTASRSGPADLRAV